MQKIIILGAVGNCFDILDTINDVNRTSSERQYQCIGFLDDNQDRWGMEFYDVPVLGGLDKAVQFEDVFFVNGIGSPTTFKAKKSIISKTTIPNERFVTIVHPSAVVSSMAQLGNGVVVFQNATITSNTQIGDHVIMLPNSVVSHDCKVGQYSCIAGGATICGNVSIGDSCYLGANCSIKEGITIGSECLIGIGCVVINNIGNGSVVVGNPARNLRSS